jgi:PAS domain S-box-containing protein
VTATGADRQDLVANGEPLVASILDCVAQPVWMVDQDGLIRFANPSAVAALGYTDASELQGKPSHQTIHYKRPDGSPFPAEDCPMLLPRTTGTTIHRADDWFVRRDGSMFPVEYWSAPIDVPGGRGAVVAFTDLSERRQAESVLRERDAILAALGQPVYVATSEGVITYVNPAGVTALGFDDAHELTGQDGHWLIHYKRRDGSPFPIEECPIAQCRTTGKPVRAEEDWWVRRDGSMLPVTYTAVPFEAPGGYGIAVSFADLTARRAAEQTAREREVAAARAAELSAGEARHRAILEAAIDGVISIDEQGRVTYVNPAAERIFGYRAGEVAGLELAEALVPPSLRDAHRRGFARYLATGETRILDRRIEISAMRADGSEFPAELTVTRADLAGVPAFIGYVRDITDRIRAKEDLEAARLRLNVVAAEQAALRRVATLVARGAPQAEVFAVVAREVAICLGVPLISIVRFETDGTATHVGAWGKQNPHPVGTSWRLDEYGASGIVSRSGHSARVDYAFVPGDIAAKLVHEAGIRSAVAVPVVVSGRLWGTMMALSTATTPQAESTEARLASFTELVATALANAEAREELQQLADEQAALREMATLVARGAEPQDVFEALAEVTGRLIGAASVNLARFTADEHNVTISGWSKRGTHVLPGTRLPLAGESINAIVWQTQAPGRVDSYEGLSGPLAARLRELGIKSEVGAPVIVDGSLWGALYAGTDHPEPLPPGAEWRLASFAELIATAIANAEARRQLQQMADEQTALREVATLVARGAEPRAVFDAVCEVTGRLIDAAVVNLSRFTSDGFSVTMAGWSQHGNHVPPGTRLPLDGQSVGVLVKRTRAPSRVDNYDTVSGQLAAQVRELGIRSGVGAPVIVDGSVWGVLIAGTDQSEPLLAGTELRVASFAELVATAVSNATARSELIESRARMITAFDAARRRVTRDLHDGAQQRFVSAIINLQLAQQKWSSEPEPAKDLLDHALQDATSGIQELREIAAGIHPAILTHRGLSAALDSLAARLPISVELDVPVLRLPEPVESSIYFFCSEALTNVVKHARANSARLRVALEDGGCTVEVRDDGIGGADSRPGTSGLTGLRDRIGALKGAMEVSSPVAAGTVLRAWLPLPAEPATFGGLRPVADRPGQP